MRSPSSRPFQPTRGLARARCSPSPSARRSARWKPGLSTSAPSPACWTGRALGDRAGRVRARRRDSRRRTAAEGGTPPIVSALPFPRGMADPPDLRSGGAGLSGDDERAAFRALPPFPEADGEPAVSPDAHAGAAVRSPSATWTDLARRWPNCSACVGDHFAPHQGGARFTSPRVAKVLAELEAHGVKGVGQSSWGPTGFAFLGSEAEGRKWLDRLAGRPDFGGTCLRL